MIFSLFCAGRNQTAFLFVDHRVLEAKIEAKKSNSERQSSFPSIFAARK